MRPDRPKVQSSVLAIGALVAAVCLVGIGFVWLEYYFAQHYFAIKHLWYNATFPSNWLSFAFYLRNFPEPESTLLVSSLTGVCGAMVWWLMQPWLRRIAGPMVVLFVAGISAVFSGVSTSFDSSLRFSAAMKDFVAAVIRTAEREGDTAAVEQLRRFDAFSNTTYEGGALLQWLAEPADLERKTASSAVQEAKPVEH